MNFSVLTLFPEMIEDGVSHSIIKRAREKGIINVNCVNIRDFSDDKHGHVDDYPFGGGGGMLMRAEPVYSAYQNVARPGARVLYMSPQGQTFDQKMAAELAREEDVVLLCGHYEGIDERVIEEIAPEEISLGDFVMTGGELAALVIIDAVSRLIPGVLSEGSSQYESFQNGLLEYPQYTRPAVWRGKSVPEVLLSGHHANINQWRLEQSVTRTMKKRPELLSHE